MLLYYRLSYIMVLIIHVMTIGTTSSLTQDLIVRNFSINPFLDVNHYIRLNLSWSQVVGKPHLISIRFRNDEDCNPIMDIENYVISDNQSLIIPSMEMEHPADSLIHDCEYDIILENEDSTEIKQQIIYRVPECVSDKCACRNKTDSPYKLKSITPLENDYYTITWEAVTNDNLTIHEIYYQRVNYGIKTFVMSENLNYGINSIDIHLPDLKNGIRYSLHIVFIDRFNECLYYSTINFEVPNNQGLKFVLISIGSILSLVIVFNIIIFSSKSKIKLCNPMANMQKLIFCYNIENDQSSVHLSQIHLRVENNILYTPLEFESTAHDQYEVPRNKITIEDEIGKGAFGKVYRGYMYSLECDGDRNEVAIKLLREDAPSEEMNDFYNEIETLKKVGEHEHIVRMLACITIQQPMMMVMELVSGGSLKNYLLVLREQWKRKKDGAFSFPDISDNSYIVPNCDKITEDGRLQRMSESSSLPPRSPLSLTSSKHLSSSETVSTEVDMSTPLIKEFALDHKELQNFALQICSGMAYLEQKGITHRDLAARNVLVTSGAKKILKISDFGMSRMGTYVSSKGRKLPLRWMSIEAIEERTCDAKSDVWSFGVVLWEIGTLGAFPYEKTADNMVLHNLKMGKRLNRPEICTDHLYSLMLKCWCEKPTDRPSFAEIYELLSNERKRVYIEFSALNPEYIFPPTESDVIR